MIIILCGILSVCLLLFLNFLSVARHPTLRDEFHFMIVKATVGQVLFSADIAIGPWTEIEIIVLVVNAFS